MTNTTKVKVSNKYNITEKSEVIITDNLTESLYAKGFIKAEELGTDVSLTTGDGVVTLDLGYNKVDIDYGDITMVYLTLKMLHERQGYRTKIITETDFNV